MSNEWFYIKQWKESRKTGKGEEERGKGEKEKKGRDGREERKVREPKRRDQTRKRERKERSKVRNKKKKEEMKAAEARYIRSSVDRHVACYAACMRHGMLYVMLHFVGCMLL